MYPHTSSPGWELGAGSWELEEQAQEREHRERSSTSAGTSDARRRNSPGTPTPTRRVHAYRKPGGCWALSISGHCDTSGDGGVDHSPCAEYGVRTPWQWPHPVGERELPSTQKKEICGRLAHLLRLPAQPTPSAEARMGWDGMGRLASPAAKSPRCSPADLIGTRPSVVCYQPVRRVRGLRPRYRKVGL